VKTASAKPWKSCMMHVINDRGQFLAATNTRSLAELSDVPATETIGLHLVSPN
jgi:hypothetical protein